MGNASNWTAVDFGWAGFGILGAILMWAAQVGPQQAVSHISEWASAFGVRNPPKWLASTNADRVVRHVAGFLLLLWVVSGLFLFFDVERMHMGTKILFWLGVLLMGAAL